MKGQVFDPKGMHSSAHGCCLAFGNYLFLGASIQSANHHFFSSGWRGGEQEGSGGIQLSENDQKATVTLFAIPAVRYTATLYLSGLPGIGVGELGGAGAESRLFHFCDCFYSLGAHLFLFLTGGRGWGVKAVLFSFSTSGHKMPSIGLITKEKRSKGLWVEQLPKSLNFPFLPIM